MKAFTLIELLVVLAIVGLMGSIIFTTCNRAKSMAEEQEVHAEARENPKTRFITVQEKIKDDGEFFAVDEERTTWLCEGSEGLTELQLYNQLLEGQKYFISYYRLPDDTMSRIVRVIKSD